MTDQTHSSGSYTLSLLITWAGLFTGPLVFTIVSYFLKVSGQFTYAATAQFTSIMAWLIFIVPTRGRIANDLEISPELVP